MKRHRRTEECLPVGACQPPCTWLQSEVPKGNGKCGGVGKPNGSCRQVSSLTGRVEHRGSFHFDIPVVTVRYRGNDRHGICDGRKTLIKDIPSFEEKGFFFGFFFSYLLLMSSSRCSACQHSPMLLRPSDRFARYGADSRNCFARTT